MRSVAEFSNEPSQKLDPHSAASQIDRLRKMVNRPDTTTLGPMVDITDLARPLVAALKTAAKPMQAEARDHAAFQRRLHEVLSDSFNGMEEPIRLVRRRAHVLSADDATALAEISDGLDTCLRKLAHPEWWKRAVFWKYSDGVPYATAANVPLLEAASVARSLQPRVESNSGLNKLDRLSFKPGGAEEAHYRRTVDAINAEASKLERLLDEAQSARKDAAAFFDAWHRGRGFVSKKFMKGM